MAFTIRPRSNGPIKLAIIGAGAAGLAVARHALSNSNHFKPTVFEQNEQIGGTWIYTPKPSNSSMYKNLRTNLPKEVMNYPDILFPSNYPSFMSCLQVMKYLEDFTQQFNILPCIKFSTRVIKIDRLDVANSPIWEIKVDENENIKTYNFDAVAICTSHFSKPRIPEIIDIELFEGKITHSHSYREPNEYAGLRVVCFGAGPSGIDISSDIAKVATKVYLSHNKPRRCSQYDVSEIVKANSTGFYLKDDTFIEVDAIIFCTGYVYSIPFLTPSCKISVNDDFVYPLHKHFINAYEPSMAFIGLIFLVIPFTLFDIQARFFLQLLLGNVTIPTLEIILEELECLQESLRNKGLSSRYTHCLDTLQWDYHNELLKEIGCKPLPTAIRDIYLLVKERRKTDSTTYRNYDYIMIDDETFEERYIGQN